MPTRAISFSVLIVSLVITILIFSQTIRHFWGFPGFLPVLSNIFALEFFPLVLVWPLTFLPDAIDPLLSFGGLIGVNIVVFLHDGCGKGESLQTAKGHSLLVQTSLSNVGFVPNSAKSLWEPTQSLVWLGLSWNLVSGSISITEEYFFYRHLYITAPDCASIAGHIMSMSPILGSLTLLYKTRFLYEFIDSRPKWHTRFNVGLHNDCLSEIFSGKTILLALILYKHLLSFSDILVT